MGSNEKFCLRWNDFEMNLSVALRDIREEKDFFDCTLSCGARQLQAHKLILSACSPFFRNILRQNPHQHPLLYLKGVEHSDLQAVLDFMYHGEVNVAQDELNSFLAVAEDLQVKGLTQTSSEQTKAQTNNPKAEARPTKKYLQREEPPPASHKPAPSRRPPTHQPASLVSQPAHSKSQEDYGDAAVCVKQEPLTVSTGTGHAGSAYSEHQIASIEESYAEEEYEDYGYEGMGVMGYEQNIGLGTGQAEHSNTGMQLETRIFDDGSAECNICGKKFVRKDSCARHIAHVHGDSSNQVICNCSVCGNTFKNLQSLKTHMRVLHSIYSSK